MQGQLMKYKITLAHAAAPPDGDFRFRSFEQWWKSLVIGKRWDTDKEFSILLYKEPESEIQLMV